ncbi:MAG: TonB-dependent receptor, partial [Bacteroidota bacterium]
MVSGRVTTGGEPGYGINVYISGTSIGTSTNLEGYYNLSIPKSTDSLTFSFLGFESKRVKIEDSRIINVNLVENSELLDEITVRGFANVTTLARKRQENVQSIPESLVVFSSKEIEDGGFEGIPDFINAVPNASFTSSQNIGTHALTVRGISQLRLAEAPVALVIDGINAPNPSVIDQELFDIEQIELVKGPQGALYGRNAIAGALNIITKKPTNEHNGFVRMGYGNGNTFKASGSSGGPIIKEKLLYRIGAAYQNSDGFITNDFSGQEVDLFPSLLRHE